jgi:hypothetical protein
MILEKIYIPDSNNQELQDDFLKLKQYSYELKINKNIVKILY